MKVVIAGVGNRLMGDDGCGSYLAEALEGSVINADVIDMGATGISAIEILKDYDVIIIIDAAIIDKPVEVIHFTPQLNEDTATSTTLDLIFSGSHGLGIETILTFLRIYGYNPSRIIIIGCKAYYMDYNLGLSKELLHNMPNIVEIIERLLKEYNIILDKQKFISRLYEILGVNNDRSY
ncbi:MAG: hydrogenase maturation protease [Candidatus Rehaiarchaeum fermentans]|nr:hydrogenase maturation protease [Candidatus Rehaiarchaeum fermentans]